MRSAPEKEIGDGRKIRPMLLYMNAPSDGDRVQMFGHGCTLRASSTTDTRKRMVEWIWGETANFGCPGDSGGPLLDTVFEDRIFGIHSAHTNERDVAAEIWTQYSEIWRDVDAWTR